MTATYSGIDPELRRLSRAGAFGVDGYVGNTPLIRLRRLLAMVTTNGIHIAVTRLESSFSFLKNMKPQRAYRMLASNDITAGVCAREDANRTREAGHWIKSRDRPRAVMR
jgi:hypothetical protein